VTVPQETSVPNFNNISSTVSVITGGWWMADGVRRLMSLRCWTFNLKD